MGEGGVPAQPGSLPAGWLSGGGMTRGRRGAAAEVDPAGPCVSGGRPPLPTRRCPAAGSPTGAGWNALPPCLALWVPSLLCCTRPPLLCPPLCEPGSSMTLGCSVSRWERQDVLISRCLRVEAPSPAPRLTRAPTPVTSGRRSEEVALLGLCTGHSVFCFLGSPCPPGRQPPKQDPHRGRPEGGLLSQASATLLHPPGAGA